MRVSDLLQWYYTKQSHSLSTTPVRMHYTSDFSITENEREVVELQSILAQTPSDIVCSFEDIHLTYFSPQDMKTARVLNSDVLFDVLALLPVKNLIGLKSVSQGWLKLISDHSFIRAQSKKTKPVLSGFFFQEKFRACELDIERISYISVGSKGTKLQQGPFSFLPEDVVVLASCNGLVCCRSCLPSQDPAIYVCNPLNKDWIKFEWHCANRSDSIGFACDLSRNVTERSTDFKVVRIKQLEDNLSQSYFTFDAYSAETHKWSRSKEICQCDCELTDNRAVYVGGVLHWLTDTDQILTYNLETELSLLIPVPVPAVEFKAVPQACIGEHEGLLHYVMITEQGLLVWLLEDYYDLQWTIACSKSLEEIEDLFSKGFCNLRNKVMTLLNEDDPWIEALAFKDGRLLFRVSSKFFLFDIERNAIEEACNVSELCPKSMYNPIVVPYSMTLIPLNQL